MYVCLQLQVLVALILRDRLTEPHQLIWCGEYWASGENIHLSPPPPPTHPPTTTTTTKPCVNV
jgi:hypothetical protein